MIGLDGRTIAIRIKRTMKMRAVVQQYCKRNGIPNAEGLEFQVKSGMLLEMAGDSNTLGLNEGDEIRAAPKGNPSPPCPPYP